MLMKHGLFDQTPIPEDKNRSAFHLSDRVSDIKCVRCMWFDRSTDIFGAESLLRLWGSSFIFMGGAANSPQKFVRRRCCSPGIPFNKSVPFTLMYLWLVVTGTYVIFPYIWNNHPNWLICFNHQPDLVLKFFQTWIDLSAPSGVMLIHQPSRSWHLCPGHRHRSQHGPLHSDSHRLFVD